MLYEVITRASSAVTVPRACSGDMYAGVPTTSPSSVTSGESGVRSTWSRRSERTALASYNFV